MQQLEVFLICGSIMSPATPETDTPSYETMHDLLTVAGWGVLIRTQLVLVPNTRWGSTRTITAQEKTVYRATLTHPDGPLLGRAITGTSRDSPHDALWDAFQLYLRKYRDG